MSIQSLPVEALSLIASKLDPKSRYHFAASSPILDEKINPGPYSQALKKGDQEQAGQMLSLKVSNIFQKIKIAYTHLYRCARDLSFDQDQTFSSNPLTEERIIRQFPQFFLSRSQSGTITPYDFRVIFQLIENGVEFDRSFQIQLLEEAGKVDFFTFEPLKQSFFDLALLLVQINPDLLNSPAISPLIESAARANRFDLVNMLLPSKWIDEQAWGNTFFHVVESKQRELFNKMIDRETLSSDCRESLVRLAAYACNFEMLAPLLKLGSVSFMQAGMSLLNAAQKGHLETLKALISTNKLVESVLQKAIVDAKEKGHQEVVDFLENIPRDRIYNENPFVYKP